MPPGSGRAGPAPARGGPAGVHEQPGGQRDVQPPGGGRSRPWPRILAGVERLEAQASQLIVVSNDLGADGAGQYDGGTRRYLAVLGQVNRALTCRAQAVCEVVCGIPLYHKGGRG